MRTAGTGKYCSQFNSQASVALPLLLPRTSNYFYNSNNFAIKTRLYALRALPRLLVILYPFVLLICNFSRRAVNWGAHCNFIALACTVHPRSVELFFQCLGIILLISLLETSNRHVVSYFFPFSIMICLFIKRLKLFTISCSAFTLHLSFYNTCFSLPHTTQ